MNISHIITKIKPIPRMLLVLNTKIIFIIKYRNIGIETMENTIDKIILSINKSIFSIIHFVSFIVFLYFSCFNTYFSSVTSLNIPDIVSINFLLTSGSL